MISKEQERICRKPEDVESLAISLANQAPILTQRDRRPEASRAKHIREIKEQFGL